MDRYVVFVFSLLIAFTFAGPVKKGRSDYTYNKATQAYYKLHIEARRWSQAQEVCKMEGAELMKPQSDQDIVMVHGMMKRFPDIGQYVWIGEDGQKHEEAEETPIIDLTLDKDELQEAQMGQSQYDVVTRDGEIETMSLWTSLPFVCKVMDKDTYYDDQCGVYVEGYTYLPTAGSCYKVPALALTWYGAYAECQEEGAHLAIINSAAESLALKDHLNKIMPKPVGANADYFYFIGIKAERPTDSTPRVFKTIFNQTLQEAGFDTWSEGEPNNHQDSEYCGSLFRNNGFLNDINCSHLFGFLCEKEVQLQA